MFGSGNKATDSTERHMCMHVPTRSSSRPQSLIRINSDSKLAMICSASLQYRTYFCGHIESSDLKFKIRIEPRSGLGATCPSASALFESEFCVESPDWRADHEKLFCWKRRAWLDQPQVLAWSDLIAAFPHAAWRLQTDLEAHLSTPKKVVHDQNVMREKYQTFTLEIAASCNPFFLNLFVPGSRGINFLCITLLLTRKFLDGYMIPGALVSPIKPRPLYYSDQSVKYN